MGPRNLLILFFSTVAVSLVVLIIFFSLFFKNMNLNFNARMPESAPILGREYANEPPMRQDSKAEGFTRASVNVPPDTQEPPVSRATSGRNAGKGHESELEPPPISDDALMKGDNASPSETTPEEKAPSQDTPSDSASGALPLPDSRPEQKVTSPAASAPSRTSRTPSSGGRVHHHTSAPTVPEGGNSAPPARPASPAPAPAPQPPAETPSGPPVPGGNG